MKYKLFNYILIIFIALLILVFSGIVSAGNTIIPYSSQVQKNGAAHDNGNASIYIYNLDTSGTELYHESFNESISQGLLQVMLGYQNESLALTAGNMYWMDVSIDGVDTNATINGTNSDRFPFIAPISAYQPLNVSKFIVNGGDADDAINLTGGFFSTAQMIIANAFNVTPNTGKVTTNMSMIIANFFNVTFLDSQVRTNGTVTILNSDVDDALNVSGGLFIGKNANFNNFFNITTTTSSVATNGTVKITSASADSALNVSTGGAYIKGNLVVDGTITGGGGLPSANDVEWVFVGNYSYTNGTRIGSLPPANVYRVVYYINFATGTGATFNVRFNNITSANYGVISLTGGGGAGDEITGSTILEETSLSLFKNEYGGNHMYYGEMIVVNNLNGNITTSHSVTNGRFVGDTFWNLKGFVKLSTTTDKLSDITFYSPTAANSGTVIVYKNRFLG